jgi:hypothetical protein
MNENTTREAAEHNAGCVALAAGDTLRVVDPDSVLVYVPQGYVWITEQGGGDDIVLREGEWFRLRRPGAAVAEALADSVLMLTSPSAERPAHAIQVSERPQRPAGHQEVPRSPGQRAWEVVQRWWRRPGSPMPGPLAPASRMG